jgi:hypothetical protein
MNKESVTVRNIFSTNNEYFMSEKFNINALINDITEGKCVLFLGPELLVNKAGKYYKAYFKELAEEHSDCIIKYFARDNLFSVSPINLNVNRRNISDMVSTFYKEAGDENILNFVSQLPFPLIINVAPDNAINNIFKKNNYNFRSGYFPNPKFKTLAPPSIEDPIIYNIFGSIESSQSLIIRHHELFKTIKALIQKDSIPTAISEYLKEASSFIFLGVEFETWYYQLLLSILEIDDSVSVRIGTPDEIDDDTVSVMNSHFQIAFSGETPFIFLKNIYDSIKKDTPDFLRKQTAQNPLPTAYVSYAWRDDEHENGEEWTDRIDKSLSEKHQINIFRDRKVLTIQDSIDSFMKRIGTGKAIIVVVSDKYLKSEYCMYEAWQIYKNGDLTRRVFLMVLPDVVNDESHYIDYWINKIDKLGSTIVNKLNNNFYAADKLMAKNKTLFYIYLFINEFISVISDTIHLHITNEPHVDEKNFEEFINMIVKKLNEE